MLFADSIRFITSILLLSTFTDVIILDWWADLRPLFLAARHQGKGLEGKGLEGKGLEGTALEGKGLEGPALEGKGLEGPALEGKGLGAESLPEEHLPNIQ